VRKSIQNALKKTIYK